MTEYLDKTKCEFYLYDQHNEIPNEISMEFLQLIDYLGIEDKQLPKYSPDEIEFNYNLAVFYGEIKEDYEKAEYYIKLAADKGLKEAQYNLGLFYNEIKEDYDKAEHYYKLAAHQGLKEAQNNLGCFYFQKKRNYDLAEHYYKLAVDQGLKEAQHNLGIFYDEIRKDYDKVETKCICTIM